MNQLFEGPCAGDSPACISVLSFLSFASSLLLGARPRLLTLIRIGSPNAGMFLVLMVSGRAACTVSACAPQPWLRYWLVAWELVTLVWSCTSG